MSFVLFRDTVCGHPASSHYVNLNLGFCYNPPPGASSILLSAVPQCPNGGTPILLVATQPNCPFTLDSVESGADIAIKDTNCYDLKGQGIGSVTFICPITQGGGPAPVATVVPGEGMRTPRTQNGWYSWMVIGVLWMPVLSGYFLRWSAGLQ
ncbi:hypothetical protein F5Y15DRAFT_420002 [Xylariaceae sp. FL0016]|nr:hypothetical protein F5Y15DRAFT_420002 [Xylariaceae sp. FL0016]